MIEEKSTLSKRLNVRNFKKKSFCDSTRSKSKSKGNLKINKKISSLNLNRLKKKKIEDLKKDIFKIIPNYNGGVLKQELIFNILKWQVNQKGEIVGEGILECFQEGYGFLREASYNYEPSMDDIYVSSSIIRSLSLKTGDSIKGSVRAPVEKERYYSLYKINLINKLTIKESKKRVSFDNLVPLYPNEKFKLECNALNYSTRIIDLLCPIGKGQRALIVSPPKAGKTVLMKDIANAIETNNPEAILIVLLIDERPEEVTDMKRYIKGDVFASTFDEVPQRHVQVAEMVIQRAKRLVECEKDVVILLDSITRLGRAYNAITPPSGKILSGGVDSNALHKPKRFFG
jgi:transcription termination factor Rho